MQTAQTTKVRAKLTARTFIWLQGLSGLIGFAVLLEIVPRDAPEGAVILMLGAGSISEVAHRLGERVAAALAR